LLAGFFLLAGFVLLLLQPLGNVSHLRVETGLELHDFDIKLLLGRSHHPLEFCHRPLFELLQFGRRLLFDISGRRVNLLEGLFRFGIDPLQGLFRFGVDPVHGLTRFGLDPLRCLSRFCNGLLRGLLARFGELHFDLFLEIFELQVKPLTQGLRFGGK